MLEAIKVLFILTGASTYLVDSDRLTTTTKGSVNTSNTTHWPPTHPIISNLDESNNFSLKAADIIDSPAPPPPSPPLLLAPSSSSALSPTPTPTSVPYPETYSDQVRSTKDDNNNNLKLKAFVPPPGEGARLTTNVRRMQPSSRLFNQAAVTISSQDVIDEEEEEEGAETELDETIQPDNCINCHAELSSRVAQLNQSNFVVRKNFVYRSKKIKKQNIDFQAQTSLQQQQHQQQPVYEVMITEEDKELPKKLFQVKALMTNDSRILSIVPSSPSSKSSASPASSSHGLMFILSGNGVDYEHPDRSKFAINAFTGELFLIAPVDRDPPHGRDTWRLTITAETDDGRRANGSALVLVRVRDINDNAPAFESTLYRANVSENNAAGVDILRLVAIDHDSDSIVRYSIEMNRVDSEGALIFDIDELSGVLSTAVCCLDRESIDQFTIKVCAIDSAIGGDASSFHWSKQTKKQDRPKSPAKNTKHQQQQTSQTDARDVASNHSCTSVIIDVTDENDERPVFSRDKYSITLSEGIDELYPGRTLLNSSVIDADKPETNRFVCQVTGSCRFPLSKTNHNETHKQQHSSLDITNFSLPLPAALLKYFACQISANGNVRLSLDENHFSRFRFYRSLQNEYETYKNNLANLFPTSSSSISPTLSDHVNLQLRLTVSDLGFFELGKQLSPSSSSSSASTLIDTPLVLEEHLTSAEANLFLYTKYANLDADQANAQINLNEPSQAIVTKQISSYNYNSNGDDDHNPFARLNQFLSRSLRLTRPHQQIAFVVIALVLLSGLTLLTIVLAFQNRHGKLSCLVGLFRARGQTISDNGESASIVCYTPCPSSTKSNNNTFKSEQQDSMGDINSNCAIFDKFSGSLDPYHQAFCGSSRITDLSFGSENLAPQRFSPLGPLHPSGSSIMGSNAHLVLLESSEAASSSAATYSFEMTNEPNTSYDIALYDLGHFQLGETEANNRELVEFYKRHGVGQKSTPIMTSSETEIDAKRSHYKLLPDVISSGSGFADADVSGQTCAMATKVATTQSNVLYFPNSVNDPRV